MSDTQAVYPNFWASATKAGETIAVDGKVLRGSEQMEADNPNSPPHPAIMLVSAYIVERGLILKPHEVEQKTNAHQSLTRINQNSGSCCGSSSPLMLSTSEKTCELIVSSGNDYIGALKGNQSGLLADVEANFTPEATYEQINKGYGRIEKRSVSICQTLDGIRQWPGLITLIRVESERQLLKYQEIGSDMEVVVR